MTLHQSLRSIHGIKYLKKQDKSLNVDNIIGIQPTSPIKNLTKNDF